MEQIYITIDRRKSGLERLVSFKAEDDLTGLPVAERYSITLITSGSCTVLMNGKHCPVEAPASLCLSPEASFGILSSDNLCAKTFFFHPGFLHKDLTFDQGNKGRVRIGDELYTTAVFEVFHIPEHFLCCHTPENAIHLNEWLSLICMESLAQSDSRWTCRIRGYLIDILHLLMDKNLYSDQSARINPVVDATRFIHSNYRSSIKIEDICRQVHLNRTSLNERFQSELHMSIKEYLNNYRMEIAREKLRHTSLTLEEIAYQCGFQYAPYFIKQFQKETGMTPTLYRKQYKNSIPDALESTKQEETRSDSFSDSRARSHDASKLA